MRLRVRARFRLRSKKEGERTWRRRAAIALGVTAAVALGVAVYASTRGTTDNPARAINDSSHAAVLKAARDKAQDIDAGTDRPPARLTTLPPRPTPKDVAVVNKQIGEADVLQQRFDNDRKSTRYRASCRVGRFDTKRCPKPKMSCLYTAHARHLNPSARLQTCDASCKKRQEMCVTAKIGAGNADAAANCAKKAPDDNTHVECECRRDWCFTRDGDTNDGASVPSCKHGVRNTEKCAEPSYPCYGIFENGTETCMNMNGAHRLKAVTCASPPPPQLGDGDGVDRERVQQWREYRRFCAELQPCPSSKTEDACCRERESLASRLFGPCRSRADGVRDGLSNHKWLVHSRRTWVDRGYKPNVHDSRKMREELDYLLRYLGLDQAEEGKKPIADLGSPKRERARRICDRERPLLAPYCTRTDVSARAWCYDEHDERVACEKQNRPPAECQPLQDKYNAKYQACVNKFEEAQPYRKVEAHCYKGFCDIHRFGFLAPSPILYGARTLPTSPGWALTSRKGGDKITARRAGEVTTQAAQKALIDITRSHWNCEIPRCLKKRMPAVTTATSPDQLDTHTASALACFRDDSEREEMKAYMRTLQGYAAVRQLSRDLVDTSEDSGRMTEVESRKFMMDLEKGARGGRVAVENLRADGCHPPDFVEWFERVTDDALVKHTRENGCDFARCIESLARSFGVQNRDDAKGTRFDVYDACNSKIESNASWRLFRGIMNYEHGENALFRAAARLRRPLTQPEIDNVYAMWNKLEANPESAENRAAYEKAVDGLNRDGCFPSNYEWAMQKLAVRVQASKTRPAGASVLPLVPPNLSEFRASAPNGTTKADFDQQCAFLGVGWEKRGFLSFVDAPSMCDHIWASSKHNFADAIVEMHNRYHKLITLAGYEYVDQLHQNRV